jgi:hypothetical protein
MWTAQSLPHRGETSSHPASSDTLIDLDGSAETFGGMLHAAIATNINRIAKISAPILAAR